MNTFSMNPKRIKTICNLIEGFLKYPFDLDILRAYCLGFVLAVSMFSDIDMTAAQDLNNFVKIKAEQIKEKSKGVH